MFKYTALFAAAAMFVLVAPSKPNPNNPAAGNPASMSGSWQVDARHSDAQLTTDGTTEYGKTKISVALGFARVNGRLTLDDGNPAKSSVEFRLYPATSMSPVIDEDGKFLTDWLANLSNHTLVCFHSKQVARTADGRLQATGTLTVTRIDRNVDATPSEAYAGPVYGPPVLHRVSRDATFIFDIRPDGKGRKDGEVVASGSSKIIREDFPQLVRTAVNTYWPPVVQDENCETPDPSEAFNGPHCTGTFLETPAMPAAPHASNGEDVGVTSNFNAITGNQLTILLHLNLMTRSSGEPAAGGN